MIKIAPSILSADFSGLANDVDRVRKAGADYLHIDVMDGHFVPNITIGPPVIQSLRNHFDLVFDVHLMIENPEDYIEEFSRCGADIITVHAETCTHLHRTLAYIKEQGARAGVALNPSTPPSAIEYVLSQVDMVLIMTVNPGFGGQSFIREMLPKVSMVREMLFRVNSQADIEVDGGINGDTAALVTGAGANVLVAGSAIFKADDPAAALGSLRDRAMDGFRLAYNKDRLSI